MTLPLVGLAVCGAAVVGLVVWGRARAVAGMAKDDPGVAPPVTPTPIGPFPDLKVGTVVLVDVVKAQLLFIPLPTVLAVVDQILTDRFLVSVELVGGGLPGGPPKFSGTIPRSSIIRIVSDPLPGFNPGQV